MRANSTTDPFLGHAIETAIVTRDHWRTMGRAMEGLWRLGIGSWRVYTFNPQNTTNQTYHGKPSPFALAVCFAEAGNLMWELIEPISFLETYIFPDDWEFPESFVKAPIDSESDQILGVAAFAVDADEIMGAVQVAITRRLPYTALREAIVTHPN